MSSPARRARVLVPLLLLVGWLVAGGVLGPYAGRLGEVATNDQAAFLPRSAESTEVIAQQRAFRQNETLPVIVVWTGEEGTGITERRTAATQALASLTGSPGVAGEVSPAIPAEDGQALEGVVPLRPDLGDELAGTLDRVRAAAERVPGTTVQLAGPAATQADLSDAFAGIDGLLLAVALAVVLVILLLVYRSLLLPLVIIVGSVFALGVACAVVYVLADHDVVRVDGQVQGILSILVIGAATDYALLLTARYREELARRADRFTAMAAALRQSWAAITASAATVALGLLALLLSDLTNNRALGPVGAIGIACAVLTSLTFLPAALVLLGRAAYWPARPRPVDADREGIWHRVAALVDRAPRKVWAVTLAVLLAGAACAPLLTSKGVPLDETFVNDAPSVAAQQTLSRHFPAGSGNPAVVVADAGRLTDVVRAAEDTEGVASAAAAGASGRPGDEPLVVDGRVRVDVTLTAAPDSDAAKDTVARLRAAVHDVPDADALVGGYTAQQYDTLRTAQDDRALIVPVVLAIILVILIALLRSLLLPVLLVVTVALNFLTTLGVSALVFRHILGFEGTDASVPLYGFVFLVALGVDYNIFLMSRVREETLRHGPAQGISRGLVSTGGVITSAGVVLAATFAALGVIPLAFLVQIAFIVAFGVLLDTLVVRSLLVPALVRDIGPRVWWPTAVGENTKGEHAHAEDGQAECTGQLLGPRGEVRSWRCLPVWARRCWSGFQRVLRADRGRRRSTRPNAAPMVNRRPS
ncbi:MMPL family transporter [Streptomyces sp. WAC 05379]|nr:MMPL family transporter [Streptomyces sp. WAC 05379]